MATITGSTTANGVTFEYAEVQPGGSGPGPRGIKIKAKDTATGWVKFHPITPNPHDNAAYNKDQAEFYAAAAKFIASTVKPETDLATFTAVKKGERPPTIAGDKWTKMKKDEQEKATTTYNTTKKEEVDKANKKKVSDELHKDLMARTGSIDWKSVKYTLPKAVKE